MRSLRHSKMSKFQLKLWKYGNSNFWKQLEHTIRDKQIFLQWLEFLHAISFEFWVQIGSVLLAMKSPTGQQGVTLKWKLSWLRDGQKGILLLEAQDQRNLWFRNTSFIMVTGKARQRRILGNRVSCRISVRMSAVSGKEFTVLLIGQGLPHIEVGLTRDRM